MQPTSHWNSLFKLKKDSKWWYKNKVKSVAILANWTSKFSHSLPFPRAGISCAKKLLAKQKCAIFVVVDLVTVDTRETNYVGKEKEDGDDVKRLCQWRIMTVCD